MSELVERLCDGKHVVEISIRPDRTVDAFKACLDRGYVHVRFTDTRGGTELGFPLDLDRTDLTGADFDGQTGSLTIAGALSLDFVKVRCIATIELATFTGYGQLERVTESAGE